MTFNEGIQLPILIPLPLKAQELSPVLQSERTLDAGPKQKLTNPFLLIKNLKHFRSNIFFYVKKHNSHPPKKQKK